MQKWLAFPWIRYVAWLLSGILLAHLVSGGEGVALWTSGLLALIFIGFAWCLKKNAPLYQFARGILAFGLLLCFGYWRTSQEIRPAIAINPDQEHWYIQVEQTPVETARSYRFTALLWSSQAQADRIRGIVYLSRNQQKPAVGEVLLAKARVQAVPGPLNPYEFDYRSYLATQSIHYQVYVQAFLPLPNQISTSFWRRIANTSKDYLLAVITRFIPAPETAGVVKAMVLGERSALDRTLRQAYADAGVMHVLAVSGLHVGMIFFLMTLVFRPLQKTMHMRLLWLALTLLVLWCYAWLTGLAPSAQRASVMFSIIAVGKAIQRRGNIYNSIGISAFILLVIDPLLIRQVGFQLSYLAVLGIVYLQPRISKLYQPNHAWIKKVWELFSVSLAAQVATFPLGIFYFHQFPTYFFVGNFLAVPLAFAILYSTLGLLVVHWVPGLGTVVGWIVHGLVLGLNEWVRFTERLPLSKMTGMITAPETILLYLCILAVLLLVRVRSFTWGMASFALLILLAMSGLVRTYSIRTQRQLTIYQIPGHTLLHFVRGQQEVALSFGEKPSMQQLSYHVEPARIHAGLSSMGEGRELPHDFTIAQSDHKGFHIIVWEGKRIVVIEDAMPEEIRLSGEAVDILLLRNSAAIDLEKLVENLAPKVVVVDASNSRRYREQIKSKANVLLLPLHITSEQGAYHHQL